MSSFWLDDYVRYVSGLLHSTKLFNITLMRTRKGAPPRQQSDFLSLKILSFTLLDSRACYRSYPSHLDRSRVEDLNKFLMHKNSPSVTSVPSPLHHEEYLDLGHPFCPFVRRYHHRRYCCNCY